MIKNEPLQFEAASCKFYLMILSSRISQFGVLELLNEVQPFSGQPHVRNSLSLVAASFSVDSTVGFARTSPLGLVRGMKVLKLLEPWLKLQLFLIAISFINLTPVVPISSIFQDQGATKWYQSRFATL